MMTADGVPCKDDEDGKKYVLTYLWRFAGSVRCMNTVEGCTRKMVSKTS